MFDGQEFFYVDKDHRNILDSLGGIIRALEKIQQHLKVLKKNLSEISVIEKVFNKIRKFFLLILSFVLTLGNYYFYVYWNIILKFESTNCGFNLDMWKSECWVDSNYKYATIYLLAFHFLIFMLLICFLRTYFSNPGFLDYEYIDIYSVINIIKMYFQYVLDYKNPNLKLEIRRSNPDLLGEINHILSKKEKLYEIFKKTRIAYNSEKLDKIENEEISGFDFHSSYGDDEDEEEEVKKGSDSAIITSENFENLFDYIFEDNKNTQHNTIFHKLNEGKYDHINSRYCGYCILLKPERTHHCRTCKKCVRKFDHHCGFLTICIGIGNYKFFLLTVFYLCLLIYFIIITSYENIAFYMCEFKNSYYSFLYLSFFFVNVILSIYSTNFFYYHLIFLVSNLTTVEYVEKVKDDEHQYDLGICNNISEILGGNCLFWLFPISNLRSEHAGYTYVKRSNQNIRS